jgi:hypothetical protein
LGCSRTPPRSAPRSPQQRPLDGTLSGSATHSARNAPPATNSANRASRSRPGGSPAAARRIAWPSHGRLTSRSSKRWRRGHSATAPPRHRGSARAAVARPIRPAGPTPSVTANCHTQGGGYPIYHKCHRVDDNQRSSSSERSCASWPGRVAAASRNCFANHQLLQTILAGVHAAAHHVQKPSSASPQCVYKTYPAQRHSPGTQ